MAADPHALDEWESQATEKDHRDLCAHGGGALFAALGRMSGGLTIPFALLRSSRLPAFALATVLVQSPALGCVAPSRSERTLPEPVLSASVGPFRTCAVVAGGTAWCRDETTSSEGVQSAPETVDVANVTAISVGYSHTCALDVDGTVWCWGDNRDGELGDGTREDRREPAPVRGLSDVVGLSCGTWFSCALRVDGSVYCWGNGVLGTLGDGLRHTADLPVAVASVDDAVAVAAGDSHACALHATGRVSCWGRNTWGQLGDGTIDDRSSPALVLTPGLGKGSAPSPIEGITSVDAGYAHSCASTVEGRVLCWGANWYGQLGDGTRTERHSPAIVRGLSRVRVVHAGNLNSCALLSDGTGRCWGSNALGQIGADLHEDALLPTSPLTEGTRAGSLVALVTSDRTVGVDVTGRMLCWGPCAQ